MTALQLLVHGAATLAAPAAAGCAGVACWLLTPPDSPAAARLHEVLRSAVAGSRGAAGPGRVRRLRRRWAAVLQRPMARRRAGWHRAAEVEVMIAAAAELRAGRLPKDALRAAAAALASDAAAGSPEARPSWGAARRLVGAGGVAAATAAIGTRVARAAAEEDVPAALRRPHDIGGGMQRLASCWEVALSTGSELAPVLERVAAGLRSDEALRRRTHAELAGPRSTAYLLSTLPVVTLLLGAAAGARPTAFLTTPPGLAVALAGLVFLAAGIAWSRALARTAVSRLDPP